jgi:hypothetical protein
MLIVLLILELVGRRSEFFNRIGWEPSSELGTSPLVGQRRLNIEVVIDLSEAPSAS